MITETMIGVRYPDCNRVGIVHHTVYPVRYEVARIPTIYNVIWTKAVCE